MEQKTGTNKPVIRMEHVGKTYELGKFGGAGTLQGEWKEMAWRLREHFKSGDRVSRVKRQKFAALTDISCEIGKALLCAGFL